MKIVLELEICIYTLENDSRYFNKNSNIVKTIAIFTTIQEIQENSNLITIYQEYVFVKKLYCIKKESIKRKKNKVNILKY